MTNLDPARNLALRSGNDPVRELPLRLRNGSLQGLHVLADDDPRWRHDPLRQARAACQGGAHVVQLRVKHRSDAAALEMARAIRQMTREAGLSFVVNDRFDLALLAEADGVHLGQEDLPPERLPARARARLLVGRSTHDPAELRRALEEGVDYVGFGPVFGTASKQSPHPPRGLPALSRAVEEVAPLPLVAIGGLCVEKLPAVREAGAAGAAVISAVAGAADPEAATRALVAAWAERGSCG